MKSSYFLAVISTTLAACSAGTAATPASTSDAAVTDEAASDAAAEGAVDETAAAERTPQPQFLPKVTGTCPAFATGKASFSPDGKARDVLLWVDAAKAKSLDGPLVFVWHGAGGDPSEAPFIMGTAIKAITDLGGVVAAPYHDPVNTSLPWALSIGGTDESDLRVADEILACARADANVGVDVTRIHSVGFSAGAMNTEQFALRRSGYLASIVAYSGALIGNTDPQDEANKYPAMLFHGGPSDQMVVSFADATASYHQTLSDAGQFSFVCNHGKGHTVPADGPPSAWRFLQDHPFGVRPEPYAGGLPSGFPSYCAL